MGQAINSRLNQYGMSYMGLIKAAAARAKATINEMGGLEKFCAAGERDADIQRGVAYLRDIVETMRSPPVRARSQDLRNRPLGELKLVPVAPLE
jgi:hypothetical protein